MLFFTEICYFFPEIRKKNSLNMFSFTVLYFFLYVLFFVIVAVADHDLLQALFCETVPLVSQDVLVRAEGSLYIHAFTHTSPKTLP